MWARGGQVPCTCPCLVHTFRRTAPGPQDASTSSPLGPAMVAAVVSPPPSHDRGVGPRGWTPAGPRPVQLRYESGLTGEQYVKAEAWRAARLERCPNHPRGGCSFARHGTYVRKTPRGTRIARWYCPESHTTFSLLPDCLAARFPGELDTLEAVVAHAEQAPSLAAAANTLRRDTVELPGAMRWVRRRVRLVHHVLTIVIGLLPELLTRCVAEVGTVRTRLGTESALRELRALAAAQLPALPAPLGFRPHRLGMSGSESQHHRPQHRAGIDFASSSNRPAFVGQALDLRLRQQRGQCLSNPNTLVSGHGHPPDQLKPLNSNLIRGRGPLQVLVSSSNPPLSEHQWVSPRSRLGEKLTYIANQWEGLLVFLQDGRVEMDTNFVENRIRPVKLTANNALFAGHDEGAAAWGRIASLIETCKMNGVEPYAWLKSTLEKIAGGHPQSRIHELLPWNFDLAAS